MRAMILNTPNEPLQEVELPIPAPSKGQVLKILRSIRRLLIWAENNSEKGRKNHLWA